MALNSLSKTVFYFTILLVVFWSKELFFDLSKYDLALSSESNFSGYSFVSYHILGFVTNLGVFGEILLMAVVLINAFFVTRVLLRFSSSFKKNFISSIIYVCLVSMIIVTKDNFVNQIITFLLLMFCEKQILMQRNRGQVKNGYLSGFYLGAIAVLSPIYYCFLIVMFTSQIVSLRFDFRSITASLIGLASPIFFYSYFSWLFGEAFLKLYDSVVTFYREAFLRISFNIYDFNLYDYSVVFVILTLCILGVFIFIRFNIVNNLRFEYLYYFILIMLFVGLIVTVLFYSSVVAMLPLMIISTTVIISTLIMQAQRAYLKMGIIAIIVLGALFSGCYSLIPYL